MKKILFTAIALVGLSASVFAQRKVKAAPAPAAAAAVKPVRQPATPMVASAVKPATPTKAVAKVKAAPAAAAVPAKAAAGPLKKDGTPDKRFKANKKS